MNGKKARELRQYKEKVDRLDRRVRDVEVAAFQQGRELEKMSRQQSTATYIESEATHTRKTIRQRYGLLGVIKAWFRGESI